MTPEASLREASLIVREAAALATREWIEGQRASGRALEDVHREIVASERAATAILDRATREIAAVLRKARPFPVRLAEAAEDLLDVTIREAALSGDFGDYARAERVLTQLVAEVTDLVYGGLVFATLTDREIRSALGRVTLRLERRRRAELDRFDRELRPTRQRECDCNEHNPGGLA